ncbi:MAG: hypothetical protein HN509_11155 [Halobacteriovoraceae bacterium]|jgi:DNA repair protein RecO|nr:hypothetical protein [Halobacteriovoraceae bacterium]MBT5092849.1 hypothetical protein [Halobacteriovoraceae bacterium]
MQRKIEGLLLSKTPYQERHLIGTLLLRSGKKVSVLFHGGRGGGKKKKSSILELGFMLKIDLQQNRRGNELYIAKEWNALWMHQQIRLQHKAFYRLCFYLELIRKIAPEDNLHEPVEGHEGIFRVISNALFQLEKSLLEKDDHGVYGISFFLGKLILELGIFPSGNQCCLCEISLEKGQPVHFIPDQGGFSCAACVNSEGSLPELGSQLKHLFELVWSTKSTDIADISLENPGIPKVLFQYLCYQFQMEEREFKSVSMVL